jgi:hypothetical protein
MVFDVDGMTLAVKFREYATVHTCAGDEHVEFVHLGDFSHPQHQRILDSMLLTSGRIRQHIEVLTSDLPERLQRLVEEHAASSAR